MKIDARSAIVGALLLAAVGITVAWQTPIATIQSADRVLAKLTERDVLIALRGDNAVAGPVILEDPDTSASKSLASNLTGKDTDLWLTVTNIGDVLVSFSLSSGASIGSVEPGRSRAVAVPLTAAVSTIDFAGAGGAGELRFAWVLKESADF